jgi:streptomycin 6-kinase
MIFTPHYEGIFIDIFHIVRYKSATFTKGSWLLKHYLTKWELSHPEPIARTATSRVYQVQYHGRTVILKLLTPIGKADEAHGANALRHFGGHGAVEVFQADRQAHLLEYIDGDDLGHILNPSDDDHATRIIASVLNQIHSVTCPDQEHGLIPLRQRFSSLFAGVHRHEHFKRGALIADMLLSNPLNQHVLHGDIHHGNIRHHHTRGWLAFDPKGLIGERTFDTANTLCNPSYEIAVNEERLLRTARILADETAIDYQRIMAFGFAYACLSACWSLEDGDDPTLALEVAQIIDRHL